MTNIRNMGLVILASFSFFACQRETVSNLNDAPIQGGDSKLTFTATIDGEQATRTSLSNSKVVWNTNEEINIFYGSSTGSLFTSTNDSPSTSVSFEGSLSAFTGSTEGGEALSFWSVYPYHADNTFSGTAVSAYLPEIQAGIKDNIPDRTMMMLAKTPGLSLSFKQVCATLRVVINREDINRVVIRGNQGEVLAGRVNVSMDNDGNPEWSMIENEGSTEITLTLPEDDSSLPKYYYLCLLPQAFANGITVTYYTSTLKGEYVSGSRTFERNTTYAVGSAQVSTWVDCPDPDNISIPSFSSTGWIGEVGDEVTLKVRLSGPKDFGFDREMYYHTIDLNTFEMHEGGWIWNDNNWENTYTLKALAPTPSSTKFIFFYGDPATVSFNDLAGTTVCYAELPVSILEHGEEIDFADPVTEAICLANYDRNGDGVLTINEAADVATLLVDGESPFMRPDGADALPKMTSFDELRYFTGLTEIPDYAFYRQFSLASIILPEDITSIGTRAFYANSALSSIAIPDGVGTIGDFAFGACNSIQQVTIPASVSVIGNYAFFSCDNLSNVTIEEGNLNTIGDGAFSSNPKLAWIEIPNSVTSFGDSMFMYSTIGHVRLPNTLRKIPKETFYCAQVNEIAQTSWNLITEIGDAAFGASGASKSVTVPRLLPTRLKKIGNRAFKYATLPEGFTLPTALTQIGDNAFMYCSGLTKVELPTTLVTIGYGAFSQCPLVEVKVASSTPASITQLETGVLSETFGTIRTLNGSILVPYDNEATYKSAWAAWANYIKNDVNTIPGGGNIGDDGDLGDGGDA